MAVITGTEGDDLLNADDGVSDISDEVSGLGGNDTLFGLGASDTLTGGPGADDLDGGEGHDIASYSGSPGPVVASLGTGGLGSDANGDVYFSIEGLFGSGFDDLLTGDDGNNSFFGSAGNDFIQGRAGRDSVFGDDGNDTIDGGDGNDQLRGLSGADQIDGGADNDSLIGGEGSDHLKGGDGDDTIVADAGADTLDGGAGVDTVDYFFLLVAVAVDLSAGTGPDGDTLTGIENIAGTNQDDSISGDGEANTFFGGSGDDTLSGSSGADELSSSEGDDLLIGGEGTDRLDGQAGVDRVSYAGSALGVIVNLSRGNGSGGDAEGDTLTDIERVSGSSHNDTLIGTKTDNTLVGGNGDDVLAGRAGADILNGGNGTDRANYRGSNAAVTVNLSSGNASGGHAQGDILKEIENVTGSKFLDGLLGDVGANQLSGERGDDFLFGRDGNDILTGGAGADELYGGAGKDRFRFLTTTDSASGAANRDVVGDFQSGDKIDVSAVDAKSGVSGNQAFSLDSGGAFAAGEIRQTVSGGNLILAFNVDSDVTAEMQIVLAGHTALLVGADFVL